MEMQSGLSKLGILLLLPALGLIVLAVVLLVKKPKVGLIVLGSLVAMGGLMVFFRHMAVQVPGQPQAVVAEPTVVLIVPLVALAVLAMVLLVKKPKVGLAVLGCLAVVAGLGFFLFTAPSVQTRTYVDVPPLSVPPDEPVARRSTTMRSTVDSSAEGVEWSPDANQFEADVYPSARAAAGALAGRVEARIDKVWTDAESPTAVTIVGPDWPAEMERLKQVFRTRWPQVKIAERIVPSSSSPAAPKPGELTAAFRFTDNSGNSGVSGSWGTWDGPGPRSGSEMSGSGRVVLAVQGPASSASAEAAFVDKPWADNFGKYLSEHPHPGEEWFAVSSPSPCANANEARNRANEEAARRLAPLVRQALDRFSSNASRTGLQEPALAGRIAAELQQRGFVQDQFLQRFHRPYGDVWKQSLLIRANSVAVDVLAAQFSADGQVQARTIQSQRSSWARTAFSIAGLAVLICLVCLFLNAVTKGYYAWPLRTAAVVVGLLALAAVFALLVLA
jgi:hypothetical protein